MPDRPSQSKSPSVGQPSAGGAGSGAPGAAGSKAAPRDVSAVAADLAIQQENEGLRLALREQERIVEELTNECRRLEDRLEDRYQDIDALRRELDRGERERKQAEERSSQIVDDSAKPASGMPSAASTATAKDTKKAESVAAGKGSALGFGAGVVSGLLLAGAAVGGLWLAGILAPVGGMAASPRSAGPATSAPGAGADVATIEPGNPGANSETSDVETTASRQPSSDPSQARPTDVTPAAGPVRASAENPTSVETVEPAADTDRSTGPVDPESQVLSLPDEPVAGTHRDTFLSGEATGPEMVVLEPSDFLMGNPVGMADSDARPVHKVSLEGFMIGAREVTFTDYDRFVRETGARRPRDFGWGRGSRPVVDVSWEEARDYADWLSEKTGQPYRLPTEAEWEYAARGGTSSSFWWGIGSPASRALCFDCGTRWDQISTAPTGSFPPNPFGLYDTAGNVYEWMADCYHHNYNGAPGDGSAWEKPDCDLRVARGGSFNSPAGAMRSHARNRFAPDARADILGFRVARDRDAPARPGGDG